MILLLGGTGTYFLNLEQELGAGEYHTLATPYGSAGSIFVPHQYAGQIALASRHGWERLETSPPFVNSRANIWAARELGATHILSWNGVGAINPLLQVHDLLVLDGIIDATQNRVRSFDGGPPRNEDIVNPFDEASRAVLYTVAQQSQPRTFAVGTYVCSEGPRLETAAEIALYSRMDAEVVGMTLVPEVLLARELDIAFASLAYVTNYATGIEPAPGAPRFFGVEVAQHCLRLMLQTAQHMIAGHRS